MVVGCSKRVNRYGHQTASLLEQCLGIHDFWIISFFYVVSRFLVFDAMATWSVQDLVQIVWKTRNLLRLLSSLSERSNRSWILRPVDNLSFSGERKEWHYCCWIDSYPPSWCHLVLSQYWELSPNWYQHHNTWYLIQPFLLQSTQLIVWFIAKEISVYLVLNFVWQKQSCPG